MGHQQVAGAVGEASSMATREMEDALASTELGWACVSVAITHDTRNTRTTEVAALPSANGGTASKTFSPTWATRRPACRSIASTTTAITSPATFVGQRAASNNLIADLLSGNGAPSSRTSKRSRLR